MSNFWRVAQRQIAPEVIPLSSGILIYEAYWISFQRPRLSKQGIRNMKIFVVFLALFLAVTCVTEETAKHEIDAHSSTPTTASAYSNVPPTQPTIAAREEDYIAVPLYLPTTPDDQDPLGISKISDFYDPGSWAGWFITIISAWLRVFTSSEKKFDLNTWLFLLGTNRAAFDLLFGVLTIRKLALESSTYDADLKNLLGSIGAAFLVTYWGVFHALLQYLVTYFTFDSPEVRSRRLWILEFGQILPWIALSSCLSIERTNVPALYWPGMDVAYHRVFLGIASGTAIELLPSMVLIAYVEEGSALSSMVSWITDGATGYVRKSRVVSQWASVIVVASSFALFVSMVIVATTSDDSWLVGWIPTMMFLWPLLGPFLWVTGLITSAIAYLANADINRPVDSKESCVFMPCAPQSIREEDQLYALLGGLILFLVFEVYPIVSRQLGKLGAFVFQFLVFVARTGRSFQI
jgi:hypothetical protein